MVSIFNNKKENLIKEKKKESSLSYSLEDYCLVRLMIVNQISSNLEYLVLSYYHPKG